MYYKHSRLGVRIQAKRGGLLVTALLLCAIISLITLPSYLRLSQSALRQSQRAIYNVAAVSIAETGIEQAVWASNNNTSTTGVWSGWTNGLNGSYRTTFSGLNFGGGVTGVIKVVVSNPRATNASVVCKAVISLQDGQSIEKWVFARLTRKSETMQGISLTDCLALNAGNNTTIDSWRSNNSTPYNSANRRSNAIISTTSTQTPSIKGSTQNGNAGNGTVMGTVKVGANSKAGVNFISYGDMIIETNYVDTSPPQTVTMPSGGTKISWGFQQVGDLGEDGKDSIFQMETLSLGNGGNITIKGNVTLLLTKSIMYGTSNTMSLDIDGNSSISLAANATLKIYVAGDVRLQGSSFIGGGIPIRTRFFGTKPVGTQYHQNFSFNGSSSISAIVYAPNAQIVLQGGGSQLYGAFTVKILYCEGGGIHLDESLYDYAVFSDGPLAVKSYEELNSQAAQQTYGESMNF
jgi:hypothetical protein